MELAMVKSLGGALVPMDETEQAKTQRWKAGAVVRGEFKEMRNGQFFRKWWALVKMAYDMWADGLPEQWIGEQRVLPEFERFRKDVTIMAGYCRPVYNAKGEVRLEAESLAWSTMTEDRFDKLYQATIDVILGKVLNDRNVSALQLDTAVERVLRFA